MYMVYNSIVVDMVVQGASMVKYTERVFQYTKSIIVLVKRVKAIAKCGLDWIFFMPTSIIVLGTQI